MNTSFSALYTRHKDSITDVHRQCAESGGTIIGPYLIEPNAKFVESPLKLVIVGQETGDWERASPDDLDVERQLECYRKFNLNGRANGRVHPGAFWSLVRKLERSVLSTTHACAALNLNRFSENGRRPSPRNLEIMAKLDFLLMEELYLLKPNLVVFFTGPQYDHRLEKLLHPTWAAVGGFNQRQVARLDSSSLPCPVFRTYHPTYLRRRHLENDVVRLFAATVKIDDSSKSSNDA